MFDDADRSAPGLVRALFPWLYRSRDPVAPGRLEDIFVAAEAGGPVERRASARALAGAGLEGDRYAAGRGHWRQTDACEVTLVTAEDLGRAERRGRLAFGSGEHRRNLVVSGIPLAAFANRTVRIGDAVFAFHRLRPPCGYLDRLVGRGAGKALGRGAGIGLRVVQGGLLRVGDRVEILDG
jgi:MOSC domain-containing protein YiiM